MCLLGFSSLCQNSWEKRPLEKRKDCFGCGGFSLWWLALQFLSLYEVEHHGGRLWWLKAALFLRARNQRWRKEQCTCYVLQRQGLSGSFLPARPHFSISVQIYQWTSPLTNSESPWSHHLSITGPTRRGQSLQHIAFGVRPYIQTIAPCNRLHGYPPHRGGQTWRKWGRLPGREGAPQSELCMKSVCFPLPREALRGCL